MKKVFFLGLCVITFFILYILYNNNSNHTGLDNSTHINNEKIDINKSGEDGVEYIIPDEPIQNLPTDDSKEWNYIPLN